MKNHQGGHEIKISQERKISNVQSTFLLHPPKRSYPLVAETLARHAAALPQANALFVLSVEVTMADHTKGAAEVMLAVLVDVAGMLPIAARLHPSDLAKLQSSVVSAVEMAKSCGIKPDHIVAETLAVEKEE